MKPLTRFTLLKREARESSVSRGHSLGNFRTKAVPNPLMGIRGYVAEAKCHDCDCWVQVETRPAPNSIDIGGSAVAIGCAD